MFCTLRHSLLKQGIYFPISAFGHRSAYIVYSAVRLLRSENESLYSSCLLGHLGHSGLEGEICILISTHTIGLSRFENEEYSSCFTL